MSYASRRLRKLEHRFLDESGLVPHSPEWDAYWIEKIERYISGDETVDLGRGTPFEALRMWMQQCDDGDEEEEFFRS